MFKLLMDAVVWAFKHTMRVVAEIGESKGQGYCACVLLWLYLSAWRFPGHLLPAGLNILYTLLQKFSEHTAGGEFFKAYFLDLMQHVFVVVTDTSHTASELAWKWKEFTIGAFTIEHNL